MYSKLKPTLLMALLVSACSSTQKTVGSDEYLATNIRSDGSKEFYYTAIMPNEGGSKRGKGNKNVSGGMRVNGGSSRNTTGSAGVTVGGGSGRGQHGGNRGRGGSQPGSVADEKLSEQLKKKLLASGFCRDGWMENERHLQPPNASVRGECNETATDKDRRNFPNSADISS